jgi:hypothetical protein
VATPATGWRAGDAAGAAGRGRAACGGTLAANAGAAADDAIPFDSGRAAVGDTVGAPFDAGLAAAPPLRFRCRRRAVASNDTMRPGVRGDELLAELREVLSGRPAALVELHEVHAVAAFEDAPREPREHAAGPDLDERPHAHRVERLDD